MRSMWLRTSCGFLIGGMIGALAPLLFYARHDPEEWRHTPAMELLTVFAFGMVPPALNGALGAAWGQRLNTAAFLPVAALVPVSVWLLEGDTAKGPLVVGLSLLHGMIAFVCGCIGQRLGPPRRVNPGRAEPGAAADPGP